MNPLAELLPADYLAAYEASPPPPPPVDGPLPDLVTHHYSQGGCFVLAIALHLATGDGIELNYRSGWPRHAYITDGDRVLDVLGIRPLRAARAGAEKSVAVAMNELVALLPTVPSGEILMRDIRRPASQIAAENTAAALIDITGWR
jgi:hypothetical protein